MVILFPIVILLWQQPWRVPYPSDTLILFISMIRIPLFVWTLPGLLLWDWYQTTWDLHDQANKVKAPNFSGLPWLDVEWTSTLLMMNSPLLNIILSFQTACLEICLNQNVLVMLVNCSSLICFGYNFWTCIPDTLIIWFSIFLVPNFGSDR